MEDVKINGYYPAHILTLKKEKMILKQSDCMDAGGDWDKSVHYLLNDGWVIGETLKEENKK